MDFTYLNYEKMLLKFKEDYEFVSFSKIKFSNEVFTKSILLRHDIDQSLSKAIPLAEIEARLNISSTYFLFLRSPFYNIFSQEAEEIIKKLIRYEHMIGLHFDFAKYSNISLSEISYRIHSEIDFIQKFYNIRIDAVSFHRPLSLDFFKKLELSNYAHSYEPIFVNRFKYFSDSRGLWRFGNPFESEAYQKKENLQLLIHPLWWNKTNITPKESIETFKKIYFEDFNYNIKNELKSFWENYGNE